MSVFDVSDQSFLCLMLLVNCSCNYGIYNVPTAIRPTVHYEVKQRCSQLHKSGRQYR